MSKPDLKIVTDPEHEQIMQKDRNTILATLKKAGFDDNKLAGVAQYAWGVTVTELKMPDCLETNARLRFIQCFVMGFLACSEIVEVLSRTKMPPLEPPDKKGQS